MLANIKRVCLGKKTQKTIDSYVENDIYQK